MQSLEPCRFTHKGSFGFLLDEWTVRSVYVSSFSFRQANHSTLSVLVLPSKMTLCHVMVTDAVASDCFLHALTSEREEVMGLLLGDIQLVPTPGVDLSGISREQATKMTNVRKVARVWGCRVLHRSDKRPDRVEIPPELMCNVTDEAEVLSKETGQQTRVIGWYHSHPNITPYPSHVDLGTQAMYQFIETGWVGLIFSVFHTDQRKNGRMELHCFQTHISSSGAQEHTKVPVGIVRGEVILPRCVVSRFAPLSQSAVLTRALMSENHENLEKAIASTSDGELKAALRGVYCQQLFKTKHAFLLPTIEMGNLLCSTLDKRIARTKSRLEEAKNENAKLKEELKALKAEQEVREKGLDALFPPDEPIPQGKTTPPPAAEVATTEE